MSGDVFEDPERWRERLETLLPPESGEEYPEVVGMFRGDLASALDTIDRLTEERDAARDLAFRAAFAPEEGATVQWGVTSVADAEVAYVFDADQEGVAREIAAQVPDSAALRMRVVGPWKPAPAVAP